MLNSVVHAHSTRLVFRLGLDAVHVNDLELVNESNEYISGVSTVTNTKMTNSFQQDHHTKATTVGEDGCGRAMIGIITQYDQMSDLILTTGNRDLFFYFWRFCLISSRLFDVKT